MAIDYNQYLTTAQKRSILQQRIQQIAVEAYQHEVNRKYVEDSGAEDALEQIDAVLEQLEKALMVHKDELDALPEEE